MLALKDGMSQALVRITKSVDKVKEETKKSQTLIEKWKDKSVKSIDNVIKKSAKMAKAKAKAFGDLAVDTGFKGMIELETASVKVKSIAGNSLELNKIQSELLKNSTKTGVAVNELADAQYVAMSSGVKAAESIDAAVLSSKLAISGFTDTNSALKLMTSTMDVYGLTGTEAMQSISDKMLVTQNLGGTSIGELASSLGSVTPIAKSAGISLDEVLGAVGSLTKSGQSTSKAMAGLEGIMSNVIEPTEQARDMAKKLGIDFSVSAIKSKGFAKWLEEIKVKTGGSTDAMDQLFGDVNALNAAISLTSEGGFNDFNNILGEVIDSAGMTDEIFKTMTNTIGFKLDKLKNTSKNIFTSMMNTQSGLIGEYIDKIETWFTNNEEKIQGWVQSIGDGVTKVVDFIKNVLSFVKEHEKLITTILVFVAAMYAVIKVAAVVVSVMQAWKTMSMVLDGVIKMTTLGWLVLVIGAVVAAGYALYRNWDLIKEKLLALWEIIKMVFVSLGQFVLGLWERIKTVFSALSEFFLGLRESIKAVFASLGEFFLELWEIIKMAFTPLGEFFSGLWEGISSGFKSFINFFIDGINLVTGAISKISIDIPDWVPKYGGKKFGISIPQIPSFAKGISYSPAGYARIHEDGGEIRKLSSGETIIPADKSERLLRGKGIGQDVKVDVTIAGNVIGNKQFANEVGEEVYRKVKLALDNI